VAAFTIAGVVYALWIRQGRPRGMARAEIEIERVLGQEEA
jgi:hypothetical protein